MLPPHSAPRFLKTSVRSALRSPPVLAPGVPRGRVWPGRKQRRGQSRCGCGGKQPAGRKGERLRIVFVGTEISPWSKVGGLGDVMGSLPHALASRGHQVMTICPRYNPYHDTYDSGFLIPVEHPDGDVSNISRLFVAHTEGVDHIFVDHPAFQAQCNTGHICEEGRHLSDTIYPYWGGEETDFETCYSILCQVALAVPTVLWTRDLGSNQGPQGTKMSRILDDGQRVEQGVIFVANDWPCGVMPIWLENYKARAALGVPADDSKPEKAPESEIFQSFDFADAKIAPTMIGKAETKETGLAEKDRVPAFVTAASETPRETEQNASGKSLPYEQDFLGLPEPKEADGNESAAMLTKSTSQNDMSIPVEPPDVQEFQSWVGGRLGNSKIAFVIHNMAYQGRSVLASLEKWGSPGALTRDFIAKAFKNSSWLKAGIAWSDAVLTVSPGYALELLRGGWEAFGLWDTINRSGVTGIRNGIDVSIWNPETDEFLPENLRFGVADVARGKRLAKLALQERLGLSVSPSRPLFGFVGRLEEQKGVDVLLAAAPEILNGPPLPGPVVTRNSGNDCLLVDETRCVQLAVLGTGERWLEEGIRALQYSYPGQAAGVAEFSEELAHQIFAGCDYLLVPSRYEPCGLVALCAVRYGCIPIVAPVGGLMDLLLSEKVGYALRKSPKDTTLRRAAVDLVQCIQGVIKYHGSRSFEVMRERCMNVDVSWDGPVTAWEEALWEINDDS